MSAYRSILPQRTRFIEPADFKAAPNLSVHPHSFSVPDSLEGELNVWNRMIPFLPKTLLNFYEGAFQRDVHVEVHFLNKHYGVPSANHFSINIDSSNGVDFQGNIRFMNGQKLADRGSSFNVDNNVRGNGIGKAWLKSVIELSLAFGDDALRFQAGDENGAYTWGKAGVPMDMSPEDAFKRTHLSRGVIGRLEAVRPFIPKADYHEARALARFVMKDDINRLAAMTTVVPTHVLDDLQKSGSDIQARLIEFYALHPCEEAPKYLADKDKIQLCAAFDGAAQQGRELSLPRFLLSCANWEARVDFSNAGEMQTIGAYLGGWKTIIPTSRDHDPALQL